ncbi:MAG: HlyD family efflux transporter periplasmic adaptor subunit [Candidatus Eremiobacteraeota bacterium]|nr:HlyD family efflux transporter periplasmic adaptor subunit [Candidatus Eremiobacteraeota bacterium]
MQRRILWVALAAIVVAAAFLVLRARQQTSTQEAAPQVALATVRFGDFAARVNAYGRVGAPAGAQSRPAFAVPGILAAVEVRVGQRVNAGDPLARLDTRGLWIAAQQAQADAAAAAAGYGGGAIPSAQLRSAQAKLSAATDRVRALASQGSIKLQADRQALDRAQRLYAAGVAARKDVDAAQAQLESDQADYNSRGGAQLAQAQADEAAAAGDLRVAQAQQTVLGAQAESAQARAAAAQRDYANGTLYAPADGVVTALYKHVGESVDATTPVVALGPSEPNAVTLDVAAADVRRVNAGDPVSLRLADGRSTAAGRVTGVARAVDPTTQRALVVVDGTPSGANAGDAVEASILVAHERGLLVPQTAVVQDPQSGETVVFVRVKKDGEEKFAQRVVHVLDSDGTTAMIAGVHAGERVAAQGAFQLLAPSGGGD